MPQRSLFSQCYKLLRLKPCVHDLQLILLSSVSEGKRVQNCSTFNDITFVFKKPYKLLVNHLDMWGDFQKCPVILSGISDPPSFENSSCLSWTWHSTHPNSIDLAHVSKPSIHIARILPFLDNVDLNALICDTRRCNFCVTNFYWLNP